LEIAELKANITESEDRLNILQKQLEELDQAQDIRELQDKLEENSGLLKGCFEGEKADLEKQQEQWEVQKNRYEKELATIQNELKELNKEKQVLIEKIGRYKGEIKGIESNLESVKKDILANPINETVAGEYPKWQERTEEIERLKNTYNKHLSEIKQKREELATEIPNIQGKIQELIQLATAQENELEVVKKRHDEILDIVKGLRLEWYYLDSIYLKHSSIMQYLEERLEKAKNDKEDLLAKERLAYRLLDYYGENEYFTGEPLLEDWLESWGNQFHLLDIGTRYIEKAAVNINKSVEELYQEYPLWPLVVITSEGELDKLSNKIEDQRERLTFPILILSQDEASQILSGKETIEERYVYPFTWEQNIHKEKFQLWKKELEQSAGKAVEERKHKEREEKKWQDILDNTNEFLTIYPYDKYTRLSEEVKSFKNELSDYRYQLVEKQKNEISIGKEMDEYQVKLNDLELESLEVGRKIARALDYFAQENNKEKLQEQLERKIEELTLTGRKILLREKAKERNSIVVQEAKDGIRELKSEINKILEDPTYKEVKAFTVVYGDINKTSLLEERQYIKDMLAEKQKGRLEIEREIKDVEANKGRDGELLKRKYAAAKYPVNESFSYPSNGQALIQKLLVDIKKLEEEVAGILPYLRKKEDEYKRNANIYETRRGDFFKEFEEIFHFIQPLASVKKQLSLEKTRLEERGTFLESTYQRHKDELEDIQSNIQVLDIKNGKYEFLSEHIEVILLAADVKQDLTYDRRKVLAKIIGEMESLTAELERHAIEVGRERNQFIHFLEFEVKDIRLREMAISGVRNKRDFAEILEWQKNMDKTLDRVIKIHEKNMMEHDKELSQFIQYLYTYLYTLAEEIRLIPKNTRVKIDDGWKEIFQIQVPGWDEEEGKEEIRKHVDWMISKLESDEFFDEDGKEDQGRIRKAIEKWLQSKQLLKCIMGGKEIRVKCRKVTNDGRVSSLYYSWENSNQWSGGEKWSKNMALFLGILNYVAEKRQHILPNQKRHRTVIMDNPFGKASSDHVLSPVFFIAEELGFQFIALTAHGEGRFIRDYFPVVYSCKLRPAVEGDTSILTKEKNINYAFFKDKDPMVIERIGDKEQLSIFGT
jgi:DNA repair exonuclease SbcCD ATPase subunit